MTKVLKRNGQEVEFDKQKIRAAIQKSMKNGSGVYLPDIARLIANDAERFFSTKEQATIYQIEKYVFDRLVHYGQSSTARAYEGYRAIQAFKKETNSTDDAILELLNRQGETMKENSNKDGRVIATQRDLIAGEISKDLVRRKILPTHITQAHDEGVLHFHDADFFMSPMFNCCLVNIKDMLDNGTVINGKLIESPKSFQVACTVLTQIIANVSSNQFGGQTIDVKHLGKYLARSRKRLEDLLPGSSKEVIDALLAKELESGVQTIQYQINTLFSTHGQSPFVTLFLNIEDGHEYEEEVAAIIHEIIKQRYIGIKNEKGVYITPSFPY